MEKSLYSIGAKSVLYVCINLIDSVRQINTYDRNHWLHLIALFVQDFFGFFMCTCLCILQCYTLISSAMISDISVFLINRKKEFSKNVCFVNKKMVKYSKFTLKTWQCTQQKLTETFPDSKPP